MVSDEFVAKARECGGRELTPSESERLRGICPEWLLELWAGTPLTGVELALDEESDRSGLGVSMRWMTPDEILGERNEASPGKEAAAAGYTPVGICLEGSGDPYFVTSQRGGPVVRIPHASARSGVLDAQQVEVVAEHLEQLFESAEVG